MQPIMMMKINTNVTRARARHIHLFERGLLFPIVFMLLCVGSMAPRCIHACEPGPDCERPSDYAIALLDEYDVIVYLFKVSDAGPHELYFEARSASDPPITVRLRAVALDYMDMVWSQPDYYPDYWGCTPDGAIWSSTYRSDGYATDSMTAEYTFPLNTAGKFTVSGQHKRFTCYGPGDCVASGQICTLAGMSSPLAIDVYMIKAEVLSASIVNNQIQVRLTPPGLTGTYTLAWEGPNNLYSIIDGPESKASGTYTESAGISQLNTGYYNEAVVYWSVGGATAVGDKPYEMIVLGNYEHTRYTLVSSSGCDGPETGFCYTQGNTPNPCINVTCDWTTTPTAPKQWLSEVRENGSGYHSTNYFTRETWCPNVPNLTQCTQTWEYGSGIPGSTVTVDTKLRILGEDQHGCPSCSSPYKTLEENGTVAIRSVLHGGHPYLSCGNRVFVESLGVRIVTDTGKLDEAQLDHYSGVLGCNQSPESIGFRKTIKLITEGQ